MTHRQLFKQWAEFGYTALSLGMDAQFRQAIQMLNDILGRNQNAGDPNGDGSFTATQWYAARDVLQHMRQIDVSIGALGSALKEL